jgi:hypothetical protein
MDEHYLKLEVAWNSNSPNGLRLIFYDKEAERAERTIELFKDRTIHDISKAGVELYRSLMVKFARRARWASGCEKEIAAVNLAAMIESGVVTENEYTRITRWQRPLCDFGVSAASDKTKSLIKMTLHIDGMLPPAVLTSSRSSGGNETFH